MTSPIGSAVLHIGLDDWVPFAAIAGVARQLGARTPADEFDQSLAAARELVEAGLVEIGTVTDQGFVANPDPDPDALEQMRIAVADDDFARWFKLTDAGRAEAESVPPDLPRPPPSRQS